ncbi:MAG: DMT family protein [Bdellovibrionales bacterium]|nr:DMT family protein [Bdellovibrionales bacterium]
MNNHGLATIVLLVGSNVFMTFAWYGHLKTMSARPLWYVIAASWGIAFFEYCLQVPANRIGSMQFTVAQLRIIQEVVSLLVFVGFLTSFLKQPLKLDYLWAGLCLIGAVYFVFRNQ